MAVDLGTRTKLGNSWSSRSVSVTIYDDVGALLTNLIVGFLAGACIRRTLWCVLVWFALPLVVAVLAVHPQALFSGGEEKGGAELIVLILTFTGFIAVGAGLALGALFRELIKRTLPKAQNGTTSQDPTDAPTDHKD